MTVLLLAAGNTHHLSDRSALQQHKPLLIARAGACSGDCPARDVDVAQFVYADQPVSTAEDSLQSIHYGTGAYAVYDGGVRLFSRERTFRGVIYRDATGRVWTYGDLSAADREKPQPCR